MSEIIWKNYKWVNNSNNMNNELINKLTVSCLDVINETEYNNDDKIIKQVEENKIEIDKLKYMIYGMKRDIKDLKNAISLLLDKKREHKEIYQVL